MDQIYANALLAVVASSGKHANEGLFNPRFCQNGGSWLPSQPALHRHNPYRLIYDPWVLADASISSAIRTRISTRAWTLQEELLSARKLLWTSHGLVWSCATHLQTEWASDELSAWRRGSRFNNQKPIHPEFLHCRLAAFLHRNASYDVAKRAWTDALSVYLPRRISRVDDRLTSIDGLAKVVEAQLQDRYLAGLWLRSLPEDLLCGGVSLSYNELVMRSPSWSWASLPAHCTAKAWLGYSHGDVMVAFCTREMNNA